MLLLQRRHCRYLVAKKKSPSEKTEQIIWNSTMVDAHKYCFLTDVRRNSSVQLR